MGLLNIGTPYKADWLRTHAAIVGMTGSGKTGLGIVTLEEAASLGIPAILVDPKGDLTNVTLRDSPSQVDYSIYTPGLDKTPVSILDSLKCAGVDRDRIASIATAILGLANIDVNPLEREHILLATIIEQAWVQGNDLDMPSLINAIQSPQIDRLGALSLDAFYPERERYALAIKINNFLASPSFHSWIEGYPLNIENILWKDGKPQHAIFYMSHLSDQERMFFITLLYTAVEGWMRAQGGSDSLKALIYFDEVAGYLPPVKQTPVKPVILRLLKSARAYGLGLILATQNPVDLDYMALSNIGTWMIGKLQTEQDKARLSEGLEIKMPNLTHRNFLLHSIYQDPIIFRVKDAVCELRGPLTPDEIEGTWLYKPAKRLRIIPAVPSKYKVYYHKGNGTYHGYVGGKARITFTSRLYDLTIDKEIVGIWDGGWKPFEFIEGEKSNNDYALPNIPDLTQSNFEDWIYRSQQHTITVNKSLGVAEADFEAIAKRRHDIERAKAHDKYTKRLEKINQRIDKEHQRLEQYEQRLKGRQLEQAASVIGVALSLASGRRRSLSTPMTKHRMVADDKARIESQKHKIDSLLQEWQSLNDDLIEEYESLRIKWDKIANDVRKEHIRAYKKDIITEMFGLIWIPKEDR